jgi:hypothetical protein
MTKRFVHAFWFLCAAIFLFEAWAWDLLGGFLARLAALLPFESWKRALKTGLAALPAPVVLLVFLVPLAVIEPFKLVALWAITHHHLFVGIAVFIAAKFAGLGITAFLFEATREKLLTMAWFKRFYDWVLVMREKAHKFLAPYKERIHTAVAPFKARMHEMLVSLRAKLNAYLTASAERGGFGRRLLLLREQVQKLRRVREV